MKILEVLKEQQIQICSYCCGQGTLPDPALRYRCRDLCDHCHGTGRTKTLIVKCQIEVPFDYVYSVGQ